MNMQIDKQSFDGVICFNDEKHKYFEKGKDPDMISCTTLIHRFTQEFDAEFWSRYKALQKLVGQDEFDGPVTTTARAKVEKRGPSSTAKISLLETKKYDHKWTEFYGLTIEELEKEAELIRLSYDEERERSCFRGTGIHKDMENLMMSKSKTDMEVLGLGGKIPGEFSFGENTKELIVGNIYPEILLYRISDDGKLKVAGQVDLLIVDHDGGVYICDYKSNKKIDQKSYFNQKTKKSTKMKYPLNNLDDANFLHYSLQLSLYMWMVLKANPNLFMKGLHIIHFDHEGNTTQYECEYLKNDVERMLAYYKKELEHQAFKKEREKIVF